MDKIQTIYTRLGVKIYKTVEHSLANWVIFKSVSYIGKITFNKKTSEYFFTQSISIDCISMNTIRQLNDLMKELMIKRIKNKNDKYNKNRASKTSKN